MPYHSRPRLSRRRRHPLPLQSDDYDWSIYHPDPDEPILIEEFGDAAMLASEVCQLPAHKEVLVLLDERRRVTAILLDPPAEVGLLVGMSDLPGVEAPFSQTLAIVFAERVEVGPPADDDRRGYHALRRMAQGCCCSTCSSPMAMSCAAWPSAATPSPCGSTTGSRSPTATPPPERRSAPGAAPTIGFMSSIPAPAVCVVTGANSGIGRATALHLAAEGYTVYGTVRSLTKATSCRRCRRRRVEVELGDVPTTNPAAGFARLRELTDGVVGVRQQRRRRETVAEETTPAMYLDVMNINLCGAARCWQQVLPGMRARGRGAIVNITSVTGRIAALAQSPYVASKWALEGVSEELAVEVAPFGVRVVIVEPGVTRSAIFAKNIDAPNQSGAYDARIGECRCTRLAWPTPPTAEVGQVVQRSPQGADAAPHRQLGGAELVRGRAAYHLRWVALGEAADDNAYYDALDAALGLTCATWAEPAVGASHHVDGAAQHGERGNGRLQAAAGAARSVGGSCPARVARIADLAEHLPVAHVLALPNPGRRRTGGRDVVRSARVSSTGCPAAGCRSIRRDLGQQERPCRPSHLLPSVARMSRPRASAHRCADRRSC
jgi:NAD(P)-dependent dehydrogenase (short-subunit alcohol dehydrogenase family)